MYRTFPRDRIDKNRSIDRLSDEVVSLDADMASLFDTEEDHLHRIAMIAHEVIEYLSRCELDKAEERTICAALRNARDAGLKHINNALPHDRYWLAFEGLVALIELAAGEWPPRSKAVRFDEIRTRALHRALWLRNAAHNRYLEATCFPPVNAAISA